MPLNIENERVSKLAVALANETGESITDAVGHAIEARLAELRRTADRRGLAGRLIKLGRNSAAQAPQEWLTKDYDAVLYDGLGIPR